ncbi:RNA-directed DNA polymerase, eukaryota [Tanacetum coccineum]
MISWSSFQAPFNPKYDQTSKVSKSVYVSNFPDDCSSKDLWKACNSYGNVVDVFIPNKKSKSGKRFAFVRFIKVNHLDRLIENLNTIWIGRLHLFANPVRYERPNANPTQKGFMRSNDAAPGFRQPKSQVKVGSFANVVIGNRPLSLIHLPALVLISCVVDPDFVAKETYSLVDIEGVPIHAGPRLLLLKLVYKWVRCPDEGLGRCFNKNASSDLESDSDAVSDTLFGEFNDNPDKEQSLNQPQNVEAASLDPFNIYPLLDRKNIGTSDSVSDKSIPFPPGFTPPEDYTKPDDQVSKDKSPGSSQRRSESFCSQTKMEDISSMEVKFIWGNSRFDYISSNAIGNSGGILCIWDPNTFLKDHHIISDNFVVIADRHLSDHRPILLREVFVDYGATPFRFYHSWINISGFDLMISQVWKSFSFDDNKDMIHYWSPTSEFQFHCGLKQGDPLAPYLFILVMESLHLSFARTIEAGLFKGLNINNFVNVSHLFYADDAINIQKSHLLGVGVSHSNMVASSDSLGCSIMKLPFIYLGVPMGGNMASIKAWDVIIGKLKSRLSKWKINTLSIGEKEKILDKWSKIPFGKEAWWLGVSSYFGLTGRYFSCGLEIYLANGFFMARDISAIMVQHTETSLIPLRFGIPLVEKFVISEWVPLSNPFLKVFFSSLGGAFGIIGISCSSLLASRGRTSYLMTLLLALLLGVILDVISLFLGIVGFNILT